VEAESEGGGANRGGDILLMIFCSYSMKSSGESRNKIS
jgi:hypothetical protein